VNYGRIFVESLPPYRITNEIVDVQRFMERADVELIADRLADTETRTTRRRASCL
jgi:Tfp pilus assembly protein PilZ